MSSAPAAIPAPETLLSRRSEAILAGAVLGILAVLIVPLPAWLLDILIALDIACTLLMLLITISAREPLEFSVFPSILLLMTLFRLSLNVASTRLILLTGHAGDIIDAFGMYVVGGNIVVGMVIFLILIVIQFVVITSGASRISEVAARFTLDALPGKQMAIDAEMNAGIIDEKEAKHRRRFLMLETEFHGAMDGASKFVRGDAIAGLVITAINLIGGIIIGWVNGLEITQSITKYSILTVGDGLIAQVPALIIAVAAAILSTKSTTHVSLGKEIGVQLGSNVFPLIGGAVMLVGLAAMPGLPKIPFLAMAVGLGIAFWSASRPATPPVDSKSEGKELPTSEGEPEKAGKASPYDDFLQTDRMAVDVGAKLTSIIQWKPSEPGAPLGFLERVANLRRETARANGLWVPEIRFRGHTNFPHEEYRIIINGREVGRGVLKSDQLLAIRQDSSPITLEGEITRDPVFGSPACWIYPNEEARAKLENYLIVDAAGVLLTHLGEVIRRYSGELLTREDLKQLLDKVRQIAPSLVEETIPTVVSMGLLHRVLIHLLDEHVPITNLVRILESLAVHANMQGPKDPGELAERVRADLGHMICQKFREENGGMSAIILDMRLQKELREAVQNQVLSIDGGRINKLIAVLRNEWMKANLAGKDIPLIVDSTLRRPLRKLILGAEFPMAVLSLNEIPPDTRFVQVTNVKPEDLG